jgi:hypothetical protein
MWRILEGDQREEVSLEDLKILIMAVIKLYDHKRIGVEPTEEEQ